MYTKSEEAMKIILFILVITTLTACGPANNSTTTPRIIQEAPVNPVGPGEQPSGPNTLQATQSFVVNFHNQAQSFNVFENSIDYNYEIVDPNTISQMTTKVVGNTFYISSTAWGQLPSSCNKEKFLFRELGRWVLGRNYISQQSSNVNSSLMDLGSFSCDLYVVNYSFFMRELFTQTYGLFNSNPSYNQKINGWINFNNIYHSF